MFSFTMQKCWKLNIKSVPSIISSRITTNSLHNVAGCICCPNLIECQNILKGIAADQYLVLFVEQDIFRVREKIRFGDHYTTEKEVMEKFFIGSYLSRL